MRYLLHLLLFFTISCASMTLPDGTKLETKGKATAAIITPRATWSPVIIPFSSRMVSELKDSDIPGCPILKRSHFDANDVLVNEEYMHTCESATFVKSEISAWDFLQAIAALWAAAGFP